MFGITRKKAVVAGAAWAAQWNLALSAPVYMAADPQTWDADTLVGGTITSSMAVEETLHTLLKILGPRHELTEPALRAEAAAVRLTGLRPSWMSHCDQSFRPDHSDAWRRMGRDWPTPEAVRAWPGYESARRHTTTLVAALADLLPLLAAVSGHDLPPRRSVLQAAA